MIYLYTEKQNSIDWILKNDWYFNLYTSNQPFTEQDKLAMLEIDQAVLTTDNHIETKYGIGTVRNLSTGCKTYLNVVKNPGKVVSAKECGENVLAMLFCLDEIHLFMDYPNRFTIGNHVKMMFNGKDIVTGKSGYEAWWSKEYERRAEDDLLQD